MNKNRKNAFTLVELLVVIAILAILATVSILGYSSFTKKALISNDKSYVAQVNLTLQASENGGELFNIPSDVFNKTDVKEKESESGGYFVYNAKTNRMALVDDKFSLVYGELSSVDKDNWLLVCKSVTTNYSLYLMKDYVLSDVNVSNIGIDVGSNDEDVTISVENSKVYVNGQKLIVKGNCFVFGKAKSLTVNTGASFELDDEGCLVEKFVINDDVNCKINGNDVSVTKSDNVFSVYVGDIKITNSNKDNYGKNIRQLYDDIASKEVLDSFLKQFETDKKTTIKLGSNETYSNTVSISSSSSIDLNGCTLTLSKIDISANMSLTISDSKGNGKLIVNSSGIYAINLTANATQTTSLIINSGVIELSCNRYGIQLNGGASLTINGGSISCTNSGNKDSCGTIYFGSSDNSFSMSNGQISQSNADYYAIFGYSDNKVASTITGGLVTGRISNMKDITGGSFTIDPTDFLKSGYQATLSEGKYVVSAK